MIGTTFRLASWNLNHRVGMTRYRPEAAEAAIALDADVIFFNEYFPKEHAHAFETRLRTAGYAHQLLSIATPERANRVLCAARMEVEADETEMATFDAQFASNTLCVRTLDRRLRLIGLRVPSYPSSAPEATLQSWDWIERVTASLAETPAVIVGDLNVHRGSPASRGGDHFRRIQTAGWRCATPSNTPSYFPLRGKPRTLDHLLHTDRVAVTDARVVSHAGGHDLAGTSGALSDHAAIVGAVSA